jgi:hypothetical protein
MFFSTRNVEPKSLTSGVKTLHLSGKGVLAQPFRAVRVLHLKLKNKTRQLRLLFCFL